MSYTKNRLEQQKPKEARFKLLFWDNKYIIDIYLSYITVEYIYVVYNSTMITSLNF